MLNWSWQGTGNWKTLKYYLIVADVCQFFWTRFYCIIDTDFLGNCNQLSSQVFEEEKLLVVITVNCIMIFSSKI